MTWVDGVLLFVMVISAFLAFLRGFVRESLGIAAWIGAAVAAFSFRDLLRPLLMPLVERDWVADGSRSASSSSWCWWR
jgi:membrane protein required for colicin V production